MALKDSFVREVLPYLMTTWCFLTVILNILLGIFTMHLINKQLSFTLVARSFTIQFVIIDVICDLCVLIPAAIVSTTLTWMLTDLGCQAYGVITIFVYLVTFSILSLRCLERVIRIRSPGLHRKMFGSTRRLAVLMMSVWLVDLIISGVPLSGWTAISYDYYQSGCYPNFEENLYHLIIVTFLGIGLTLILFIACHIVIFNSVNAQSNQTRIEPLVVNKDEHSEQNLPRTASQNWMHESDESYESDSSINGRNKEKDKKWFGINSSRNKNDNINDSKEHSDEKPCPNNLKRSGSYLQQKPGNDKNAEIREQLTKKHTLFSVLHSVFTHFGLCLFMIIFWMPYFIVAICRTVDAGVFRGYYSLALCFILLTYTVRPFVNYVRLYRLIKTKRRNRVQWQREIQRENIIAKQMKKSPDDRYTNKGDDYDEESSLGFDSDSSDNFQKKDEKQNRVPKLNLQGISASYENILNGKSTNSTRKKTEIVRNKKKSPSKIRRRKKKKGHNIKGLPVLSKKNRSSETDSELEWTEETEWSEESGSEFDEFVDETVPARRAQENDTKINFKRGTETNQDVDDGTKMNVLKKQDEKGMKTYDQIHNDDLSDEGKTNTGVGSVHIASNTSKSMKPVIKKINGAQEMSENDVDIQFKEIQNKSNHFELKPKEVKKGNSKVTEKDKYSKSVRQNGNKTPTDPKAKEIDKSKEETSMQYKTDTVIGPMAAKSRNIGGKTQISPSKHEKELSNELPKGNAELQRPLSSEIRNSKGTFPSNERRKTYDTLYSESEPAVTYNKKIQYAKNDQNVLLENNLNDDGSIAIDKFFFTNAEEKKNLDITKNDEHNNSFSIHPNFEGLLNGERHENLKEKGKTMPSDDDKSYKTVQKYTFQNRKSREETNRIENQSNKGRNVDRNEISDQNAEYPKLGIIMQIENDGNTQREYLDRKPSVVRVSKKPNIHDKHQESNNSGEKHEHLEYNPYNDVSHNSDNSQNNQKKLYLQKKQNSQKKQNPDHAYSDRHVHMDNKNTINTSKQLSDDKYLSQDRQINNRSDDLRKEKTTNDMKIPEKKTLGSKDPRQGFTYDDDQASNGRFTFEDERNFSKENFKVQGHSQDKESIVIQNTHVHEDHVKNKEGDVFTNQSHETRSKQVFQHSNEDTRDNFSKKNHASGQLINDKSSKDQISINHEPLQDRPNRQIGTVARNNNENLPIEHFKNEKSMEKISKNQTSNDGSGSNNETVEEPRKKEKKHGSNTHLPTVKLHGDNNTSLFENDEVDLSKVFINTDNLPSQYIAKKVVDIKRPSLPDKEHEGKDNLPDSQQKVKNEKGNTTTYNSKDKAPIKTFNIYDPEEAGPISSRSLDSKPSQNWFKVKSKITSYVAMSAKNKFSAIHGDDNIYDRSGAREIPISHIKDDRQWKHKLADVHLM